MNIQLIEGRFSKTDALDIINNMFQVKIKYHESKIANSTTEEDLKNREAKIKSLQDSLAAAREKIAANNNNWVELNTTIYIA
jgi:hypothetical protein